MHVYFPLLLACPLFTGITSAELSSLLPCLSAYKRHYKKDTVIWQAGRPAGEIGFVAMGGVRVIKEDFWGHRSILTKLSPGGLFGETFSCAGVPFLPVGAEAASEAVIIYFRYDKILQACNTPCSFHTRMIANMLKILANKNIMLTQRIEHIAQRSTRSKLLSYLSLQSQQQKSPRFSIPMDRQELADYLFVDRSAMSAELSRLQKEGIISYSRNTFTLLQEDYQNL